jgi:serine/threonine protein kinase
MILLELIQGECLIDIIERAETGKTVDYSLLPPEDFRLRVLRNIIESESSIWWEGLLDHRDLEPRNVMVRPDGSVAIIDFNHATLYEFTIYGDDHPRHLDPESLPESPIRRHWLVPLGPISVHGMSGPWGHWFPGSWLRDMSLATEWLLETYRGSDRFAPLKQNLAGLDIS